MKLWFWIKFAIAAFILFGVALQARVFTGL